MKFRIDSENGSGFEFSNAKEFLDELKRQIEDCAENGGAYFGVCVDADAECFYQGHDESNEEE